LIRKVFATAYIISIKVVYLFFIILDKFKVRDIKVDIKEVIDKSQFELSVMMKKCIDTVAVENHSQGVPQYEQSFYGD
jgi:hypothetical protein